jgi:hypothetical protein
MSASVRLVTRLIVAVLVLCIAPWASAQATRTWISGVGDDANPCSRTAPCKTFAAAISKTAAGGEIDALDPGGFGAVTVTKSITLDGGGGQVGSILASGTNGIIVNDGGTGTIVVTVRNLRINGIKDTGGAGLNGIRVLSAKALHVEHCAIFGFGQAAIDVEPTSAGVQVFVSDSELANNVTGVLLKRGASATGLIAATVERACIADNPTGVDAEDYSRLTMADSFVSGSSVVGVLATIETGGTSEVTLERCVVANNETGISSAQTVRLSETTVTGNTTGLAATGAIISFGNNQIAGNTTDGAPTSTVPLQ